MKPEVKSGGGAARVSELVLMEQGDHELKFRETPLVPCPIGFEGDSRDENSLPTMGFGRQTSKTVRNRTDMGVPHLVPEITSVRTYIMPFNGNSYGWFTIICEKLLGE